MKSVKKSLKEISNKMERKEVEQLLQNEDLTQFAKSVDRLRFIIRYATAPRSSKESVAEHSYFVAVYVLKLAQYYNFDVSSALSLALMHDYAEAYISDVPHPIKAQNPELAKALEIAEDKVLRDHLSDKMADLVDKFNNKNGPEALVCALADAISVVSYSKYELELGNSSYMRQVFDSVSNRIKSIIEMLEEYKIDKSVKKESIIKMIADIFETRIENN